MKSVKDLLKTETFWTTKIQAELYSAVEGFLKTNHLTRKEFAGKLGVSKGYITQVLNGDFNHRISKLVELALAIGKVPVLHFEEIDAYIHRQEQKVKQQKIHLSKPPVQVYSDSENEKNSTDFFPLNTGKMAVTRLAGTLQSSNHWKIIYNAQQKQSSDQLRTYEGA